MARTRMVVVGGDAAGMSAAAQARKRRPAEELEIVAFERGRYTSYSACGLPYYAGDVVKDWRDLVARTPEEHAEQDIQVRIRHEVDHVDLDARRVRVRDLDGGRTVEEPWDVLVVATGSEPLRPPIDGIDLPGVYGLSVLQDGIELRHQSQRIGRLMLPVKADGSLGEPASFIKHDGSSVNPKRQKEPHAHCIVVSPDNKYAYAADLGLADAVDLPLAAWGALLDAGFPFLNFTPSPGMITQFDPPGGRGVRARPSQPCQEGSARRGTTLTRRVR